MAEIVNKLQAAEKEARVAIGDVLVVETQSKHGVLVAQVAAVPERIGERFLMFPDDGSKWDDHVFNHDATVAEVEKLYGFKVLQHMPSDRVRITYEVVDNG